MTLKNNWKIKGIIIFNLFIKIIIKKINNISKKVLTFFINYGIIINVREGQRNKIKAHQLLPSMPGWRNR